MHFWDHPNATQVDLELRDRFQHTYGRAFTPVELSKHGDCLDLTISAIVVMSFMHFWDHHHPIGQVD
eukprot:scaffold266779_cov33-Attheya_sp.AAC.1